MSLSQAWNHPARKHAANQVTNDVTQQMKRIDYLCEYDAKWPHWFQCIEQHLQSGLGYAYRIEHVGSTNIPGMAAKPIIDVDVVAPNGAIAEVIFSLEASGYRHRGNLGIIAREAFEPISPITLGLPPHHLYACEAAAHELLKHVSFREYLRAHPRQAQRYSDLKRHLAFDRQMSRGEYVQAKAESPLIEALTVSALAWYTARANA